MESKDLKSALRSIFNAADPQGIFFGDNLDEYDPEIEPLLEVLPACQTSSEILEALWKIFQVKFGDSAGHKDDYAQLAENVFRWKSEGI